MNTRSDERRREDNVEYPSKDILDNYRRKDDPHPLSGQLSSIREDMKEFCVEMDKFVERNKFVVKDSDKTKKGESSIGEEKDSCKWWDTKERKLKVKEILRQREEAERSKIVKRVEIVEVDKEEEKEEEKGEEEEEEEEASRNVKEVVKDEKNVPSCQGVYDLLNLKKCPEILLKDVKARVKTDEDDAATLKCESVKNDNSKDRLSGLYNSLFNEMNYRSGVEKNRSRKSLSSQELLTLEKIDETAEETTRSASCIDIISSDVDNSEMISVKSEPVGIKIVETSNALNSTDDEVSDSESVKTIINNYDKPRGIDEEVNASTSQDMSGERGENNCGRDKADNAKKIIEDNDEIQSSEEKESAKVSSSTNIVEKSSKSHKRSRDCECQDVASKKFHLIEEMEIQENATGSEKMVDGISEKCKRHFIKEAREFVKKESPLIDRCIEDLISKKSKGNWDLKNNQEEFLTCTALNIATSDIFSNKSWENSDKRVRSTSNDGGEKIVRRSKF